MIVRALATLAIWIVEAGYLSVLAMNSFGSSGEYGVLTGDEVKMRFFVSLGAAIILTVAVWGLRKRQS